MRQILIFCFALLGAIVGKAQTPFALGADISGTTELEARGVRLYNRDGAIRENTALMKEIVFRKRGGRFLFL